ncbi:uncharacterized protein, PH0010 family/AmmeMemoRadiSam system protein A/AmmeMemoRadiSam system protein B [Thermosyntropha lipolytica DSM 11003]|uniref:Uncharacterized protein, PH0010 family/AmmeMemoRadiSam system protein A/AmmeMemoRadiSam system protein B n=1 Tax=Thermosyntropha lipolytica DSM 11003 TaxID=1123382 RepID=A0A1M5ME73_9FIRM|nr:AmmeMemoRadiSam system protein A [Thermosyntropha lipolytica]SHG75472.1 uncharacterized protein, PH0010 family/AmmeMemoRadiSam system protein A/AmmeMemoRadiSam system protein B [Thermosyntropha lipolytica DSM 11003]
MLAYAALMPHPPIIIPEIGGENSRRIDNIAGSMENIGKDIRETGIDTLVFITPHGNVFADVLTCLALPHLYGDLRSFGCPGVKIEGENDRELLYELARMALEEGIDFFPVDEEKARKYRLSLQLDHGILVPLYFLKKAGIEKTRLLPISTGGLPLLKLYAFGQAIVKAAASIKRRIAIIASGDMSHRLKEDGPYGYHPQGPRFDRMIKEYLEKGDVEAILNIPEEVREEAGECGYRSLVIMLGALDGRDFTVKHVEYAGPFGVGYLTAGIIPGEKRESLLSRLKKEREELIKKRRENESMPVRWARQVIESYVKKGVIPELPPDLASLKKERKGAFVSLKKDGRLRGCIGTIFPCYDNLAEEIAYNAISAATRDPRFLPVEEDELEEIVYSVDVLEKPEPCTREDLDPKKYGVIVSKGNRKGLLLPDLEGVDTVEEQLKIALQKAGIGEDEDYRIERFTVTRYS